MGRSVKSDRVKVVTESYHEISDVQLSQDRV